MPTLSHPHPTPSILPCQTLIFRRGQPSWRGTSTASIELASKTLIPAQLLFPRGNPRHTLPPSSGNPCLLLATSSIDRWPRTCFPTRKQAQPASATMTRIARPHLSPATRNPGPQRSDWVSHFTVTFALAAASEEHPNDKPSEHRARRARALGRTCANRVSYCTLKGRNTPLSSMVTFVLDVGLPDPKNFTSNIPLWLGITPSQIFALFVARKEMNDLRAWLVFLMMACSQSGLDGEFTTKWLTTLPEQHVTLPCRRRDEFVLCSIH